MKAWFCNWFHASRHFEPYWSAHGIRASRCKKCNLIWMIHVDQPGCIHMSEREFREDFVKDMHWGAFVKEEG
jgi:hypothetical protein